MGNLESANRAGLPCNLNFTCRFDASHDVGLILDENGREACVQMEVDVANCRMSLLSVVERSEEGGTYQWKNHGPGLSVTLRIGQHACQYQAS